MAYAQRIITSNTAGDQEFTFTFDYIKEEHIKVFVNFVEINQGTGSSEFQVITNTTPKKISLNTGLASNNTRVEIRRVSSLATPLVDFEDGSTLTATDLDTAEKQSLFIDQELDDALKQGVSIDASTGLPSLSSQRLSNVADPVNAQDVVTKNYLERSGSITSTQIADGTIVNADVNASAAIAQSKLNIADATTSASGYQSAADKTKLDGIESNAKDDQTIGEIKSLIAGSPLDASHLAANSVDTSELADNAVTNAKIADAELKTLAGMQSGTASKLADSTALTSDIADLNQLDGLQKQTTITDDDTKFPTSGAIVDYVAAQLAPIGGLEAIANENSFPNTQPQSGVVISIADAGGMAVSSTGTASGQTVGGTTVNISGIATNFRGSSVAAGVRFLVVSTGSGQNYTYHKATLKEDDLVGLSGDINDFGERYRIGSSFPTTNNDSGDLFWHTTIGKLYVYNGTTSAFEETQSIGNFFISTLSPAFDGSTTNFTLTNAPTSAQQILLIIEGVIQKPNSGTSTPTEGFALDGSTVKLAAAPAVGASYHVTVMGSAVNTGTPSDNSVTTAILQNNSVSTGKIQDEAITLAKLEHGTSSNNGKFLRANNGADPSYETVNTDLVSDTTPQLGGDLDCNGNNIALDDANTISFGDNTDLQIYHSSDNIIKNAQTGKSLKILSANNNVAAVFEDNASTELYEAGSKKFETSSTGVNVTGTCTATAFAGDGSGLTGLSSQVADGCILENNQTISNNYTMGTNKSGMSVGPININNGITVTIPSGSRYVIL